ncbi:MAG: zf-HC2 domain-containing protein [Planctomycetota bacterium]
MNCSKVQKIVLDYVYEELPARKVLEFERHVRDCPECARKLEEIQFTRRAFSHIEVKVPSNGTVEKVLSAARESASARGSRGKRVSALRTVEFWRPFLAGAACLLFMMAIVQMVFHPFTRLVPVPFAQPVADDAGQLPVHMAMNPTPNDRSAVDNYFEMAQSLMAKGYRKAPFQMLIQIHNAVPQYEKNYLVSLYIGEIYQDVRMYDKAQKYYAISIQQKPDNPEAKKRIAEIEHLLRVQQETDG